MLRQMIGEPEELRHAGTGSEMRWLANPVRQEGCCQLVLDIPQARSSSTHDAWRVDVGQQRHQSVVNIVTKARPAGFIVRSAVEGRIVRQQLRESMPHTIQFRIIDQACDQLLLGRGKRIVALFGEQLLGHGKVVWFQSQVRPNSLGRPIKAIDLVTAKAAELADQVIALDNLRCWRLRKLLTGSQLGHIVMALQAAGLNEPLRVHRVDPVVIIEPAIVAQPAGSLFWRVGRV